jgi:peptidoglycan/LPS O-acetylase OafA/YrhL
MVQMKKRKRTLKESCWPDVTDTAGRRDAVKMGAMTAGWIAISYAIAIAIHASGSQFFGPSLDELERTITIVFDLLGISFGLLFAVLIWRKSNRIAAGVTLVWIIFEVTYKFVMQIEAGQGGVSGGLFLGLIFILAAINGVRGTLAERKFALLDKAPVKPD